MLSSINTFIIEDPHSYQLSGIEEKIIHMKDHEPHLLLLTYPAQGHISPLLQFGKRLVARGVKVTLVITKFIAKSTQFDENLPMTVETISDGYDEGRLNSTDSFEVYFSTLKSLSSKQTLDLVEKFKNSDHPVSGIVYDAFMSWFLQVAKTCSVLSLIFFTQTCAVNSVYYHVQSGDLSLPISNDTIGLPGLPPLQASDAPSFVTETGYKVYPSIRDLVLQQVVGIDQVDWVIFNIFYDLEPETVDWMAKRWRVATIGPTVPSSYLDNRLVNDKTYGLNLFDPNTTCMSWLQDKPENSVVYVSFGSMAELGEAQMAELAWGLKLTGCYFVWVVRKTEMGKLPSEYAGELTGRGLLVTWCSQLDVLAHEAVGCFVTHCGFNSILEAISLGVPMVGVPQWTDQPTNAKFVEDVWKVGVRARADENGIVRREIVAEYVRGVMEGEGGKEMRKNAKKLSELGKKAVSAGGSSDECTGEIVASLVSSRTTTPDSEIR